MKSKLHFFCSLIICSLVLTGFTTETFASVKFSESKKILPSGSYREDVNGWIFTHIQGSPSQRGYDLGFLLAEEIDVLINTLKVYLLKTTTKDWDFYRSAAGSFMVQKLGDEFRAELTGITEGLKQAGKHYELEDIVALNAFMELSDYYLPYLEREVEKLTHRRHKPKMRCSAFIATGDWTHDGGIVMAHNSWDDYIVGHHMNVVLDINPDNGNRIIMQSLPGFIHSATDFAVNSAGLCITETTIGNFNGFDTTGIPEFIRARTAVQYANNIDEFVTIMKDGNNGGYANSWLIGDVKNNEIAKLELGLINVAFYRSFNGFYDGENYVDDSKMIREECYPNLWLEGLNCVTARRDRWYALLPEHKGQINATLAKQFIADQYQQSIGRINPGGFVIMARMELTDVPEIQGATAPRPFGANDGKVVTADLIRQMSFWGRMGHPDGSSFEWDPFFKEHPEFAWQRPYLPDLKGNEWTLFKSVY